MYQRNSILSSITNHKIPIAWTLIVLLIPLISGCLYYKVTKLPDNSANMLAQFEAKKKYIVFHHGSNAWHISNIRLDEFKKEMQGKLSPLAPEHLHYLQTKTGRANAYNKSNGDPTMEVHIYANEYQEGDSSQISVNLTSISKIEAYESDAKANTAVATFKTLGIIVASIGILFIIILATKSSCPFVYTVDSSGTHFIGEIYSGAIYPKLERDDYLPLSNTHGSKNEYTIKITNELLEKQYTNLAELIVLEHPQDVSVNFDKYGSAYTYASPQMALTAISPNRDKNYPSEISKKDSICYLFDQASTNQDELSELILSFRIPDHANQGKLLLTAKNSYWLEYAYGKFNEKFGSYFNSFSEQQKKEPAVKHINWMIDQSIPLSVFIETENGWQFIDYFHVVGPLAAKDLIMPIDLHGVCGDELRIKLQCGFMFWEVDYAAMDFTDPFPIKSYHLTPRTAIDENGKDVSSFLECKDRHYLLQAEIGNVATITYLLPSSDGNIHRSYFLHSSGYYEYIRDYKGFPDIAVLQSCKYKNGFPRFSKKEYLRFVKNEPLIVKALNQGNQL